MFCGLFGTQNKMVAFIFRFNPRKGQHKVKLGQKGQIFKIKFLPKNIPIVSSFVSGFQKMSFIFLRTIIRNAIKCISKSDVINFTCLFYHCSAKYKAIALKFSLCVVCMQLYNIYSVFWITPKFSLYKHLFFKK